MSLPLVDEIRAARAALAEASAATLALAHAEAALSSLDLVERQLAVRPEAVTRVPGDDVVAELAESWAALSDLPSAGPARGDGVSPSAFAARRAQLELARAHLRSIGRAIGPAGVELNELQQRQHVLLETPAFSRDHDEIVRLVAERDHLAHEALPLQQQLGVLVPTLRTIEGFLAQIDSEIGDRPADAHGLGARRTASLLDTLLRGLDGLLAAVGLRPTMPAPPPVPPGPDAQGAEALWDDVVRARDGLEALMVALAREAERLRPVLGGLEARRAVLDATLLQRMG